MAQAQIEIDRLQGLIDDPNTTEALKIAYIGEKNVWISRLPPVAGKHV